MSVRGEVGRSAGGREKKYWEVKKPGDGGGQKGELAGGASVVGYDRWTSCKEGRGKIREVYSLAKKDAWHG